MLRVPTVAQKSFASKHNSRSCGCCWCLLLHRNHLHQNTTVCLTCHRCLHCCTEIICIKTQRAFNPSDDLTTVAQKSFASKHNRSVVGRIDTKTVAQKSFASKHNAFCVFHSLLLTVAQKSFASKHNTCGRRSARPELLHRNHLHQNTTSLFFCLIPFRLLHRNHLHQNTTFAFVARRLKYCCTEIICIKTQPVIAAIDTAATVAQKSFASKHNLMKHS